MGKRRITRFHAVELQDPENCKTLMQTPVKSPVLAPEHGVNVSLLTDFIQTQKEPRPLLRFGYQSAPGWLVCVALHFLWSEPQPTFIAVFALVCQMLPLWTSTQLRRKRTSGPSQQGAVLTFIPIRSQQPLPTWWPLLQRR